MRIMGSMPTIIAALFRRADTDRETTTFLTMRGFTNGTGKTRLLRQHRVDYDEKTRAFKKTAKEDWTSDAADAFRYVAMAWREIVKVLEPPKKRFFIPMEEITMDQLISFEKKERPERA
jgi:hypothetical protein